MGSCYICLIFYVIEWGAVAWTENETSLRVTVSVTETECPSPRPSSEARGVVGTS